MVSSPPVHILCQHPSRNLPLFDPLIENYKQIPEKGPKEDGIDQNQ
jgi:hypothetical protein